MLGVKNLPIYGKTQRQAMDFEALTNIDHLECNIISTACNSYK